MEPINYNIDVATPMQSMLQGFQGGLGIRTAMQQQQQLKQQQEAQLQMQKDLAAVANNPNAGAQDYAGIMLKYPQLADHFKKSWDVLSADQQQNKLQHSAQVYSALQSGNPDIAVDLLNKQAEAYKNSGKEQDAQAAQHLAQMIQVSPQTAKTTAGLMLSSVMGTDKFAQTFGTLGDQNHADQKQPYEVQKLAAEADAAGSNAQIKRAEAQTAPEKFLLDNANTRSQINERAGRLQLDKDKLTSDVQMKLYELGQKAGQLDEGAKKIINDSTIAAVAADQSANQMNDLATRIEQEAMKSGVTAKGAELYKSLTGNQDAITQLRQEYTRIRSQGVLKNLPPGPASDKDIQMAQKGFPEDTADPAQMAQFLRGMAKIQQYDAVNKSAQTEWVNAVGHMGKPKTDIEVEGIKVPAGSTYTDFAQQFFKQKTEQKAAASAVQSVQSRSYMKYATPGAQ